MLKHFAIASLLVLANCAWAQDYMVDPGNPQVFALCYENNVDSGLSCACSASYPLVLHICNGQLEACCDQVIIYDGLDDTAPILYASIGVENLNDLVVTSSNPDRALRCEIVSNGTNSCATEGYIPIVFSVNCAEAVACDIGVPELTEQKVELFPEPSDGLLTLRSQTALSGMTRSWVCDLAGRTVFSGAVPHMSGNMGTLDLRSLSPGQYVLHMNMGDGAFSQRFSIVR